ncbi:hypothetical protein BX600DRAFT_474871 [Xylariales sp. PMI_506]|nr:hypothetical protein BX600DRAFT_474871 [Xylariales sp. PMI_506]
MTGKSNLATPRYAVPFSSTQQLVGTLGVDSQNARPDLVSTVQDEDWLPGHPGIPLRGNDMMTYLRRELPTPRLNKMHPYLWLVGTQSSSHISPLHDQLVRGRRIIIAENPELHLVWVQDKIFIKPIPAYLLSHSFWEVCLSSVHVNSPFQQYPDSETLREAALGYLRTYYYLIRHESDFRIAMREQLIPVSCSWPQFVAFISPFRNVVDDDVSLRYRYGQLRLTRLNIWAPVALGQWVFQKISWQYSDIFARFFAPLLFLFGTVSVILSAMQVGTQARPDWDAFSGASAWFSVLTLLGVAVVVAFLLAFLIAMLLREAFFAFNIKLKPKSR